MANTPNPKVLYGKAANLTDFLDYDEVGVGTLRPDQYGNKFRWVENIETAIDARAGGPACFDAGNYASSALIEGCLCDTADEDIDLFAGVWMSAVPFGDFGWIQAWGRYKGANFAIASGGSIGAGDQMIPSTLVTTTGTSAARPFAFIIGADISVAATTSQDTVQAFIMPHVVSLIAVATGSGIAGTIPQTASVFIKGLV